MSIIAAMLTKFIMIVNKSMRFDNRELSSFIFSKFTHFGCALSPVRYFVQHAVDSRPCTESTVLLRTYRLNAR